MPWAALRIVLVPYQHPPFSLPSLLQHCMFTFSPPGFISGRTYFLFGHVFPSLGRTRIHSLHILPSKTLMAALKHNSSHQVRYNYTIVLAFFVTLLLKVGWEGQGHEISYPAQHYHCQQHLDSSLNRTRWQAWHGLCRHFGIPTTHSSHHTTFMYSHGWNERHLPLPTCLPMFGFYLQTWWHVSPSVVACTDTVYAIILQHGGQDDAFSII